LLYEFHLGKTAVETTQNICTAYGDGALSIRTCERWFAKFRSGNENLEDEPHQRRPPELSDEDVQSLLDAEPQATSREIAEKLGCSRTAVENHLQKMGKVYKFGMWVHHELTEKILTQRMAICSSLLSRFACEPFLDRIVTGDEKWVLYINVVRKRPWLNKKEKPLATPKPELHPTKGNAVRLVENDGNRPLRAAPNEYNGHCTGLR
jgi:histone-lysine N-methyltransferase SETMAR